jgi:single-strand DNA-binding protein
MNSLNISLVEGRLTRDPLTKTTEKGSLLCTFSIAYNRYYRKGEETEKEVSFFDIEAWGKTAELCRDIAVKGMAVRVTGRLKQDRWDDADGSPHSRVGIIADRVEFRSQAQQDQDPEPLAGNGGPEPSDIPF